MGLPRSHRWTLRNHVGGDFSLTQAARCGIPAGNRVHEVAYFTLSGHELAWGIQKDADSPSEHGCCPIVQGLEAGGNFPVGLSSLCVLAL